MAKKDDKLDLNQLLAGQDFASVAEKVKMLTSDPEGAKLIRQIIDALGVEGTHGQS